jgi:hypothetical protein
MKLLPRTTSNDMLLRARTILKVVWKAIRILKDLRQCAINKRHAAATVIAKIWRGRAARKRLWQQQQDVFCQAVRCLQAACRSVLVRAKTIATLKCLCNSIIAVPEQGTAVVGLDEMSSLTGWVSRQGSAAAWKKMMHQVSIASITGDQGNCRD